LRLPARVITITLNDGWITALISGMPVVAFPFETNGEDWSDAQRQAITDAMDWIDRFFAKEPSSVRLKVAS